MKSREFEKSDEQLLNDLRKIWRSDTLEILGQYYSNNRYDKSPGLLVNLSTNDREIVYPKLAKNRVVTLEIPHKLNLEEGEYYKVLAKLAPVKLREKANNPYLLELDQTHEIKHVPDYTPPKEFIKRRFFEKGHTPDDASTIAAQLSLNELELYTHTKRFIFELIQNADDMPRKGIPVDIRIFLTQNHLLFLHNGKFFDREDVKAICDAAKSTKAKDVTQTGYKGIGFKSVFTDSSRVYINSGSYSFKFDKNEGIYNDFWKLYDGYFKSLNDKAKSKTKRKYSGNESEYLNINSIPWQIKPIWVEKNQYPDELIKSPFNKFDQVKIALDVGEDVLNDSEKDYHKMIMQLIKEPRFLLFLRNTGSLSYKRLYPNNNEEAINIDIDRREKSIKVSRNGETYSTYSKKDFDVKLDNNDYKEAGLNFQKVEKKGKAVYVDLEGNTLDNIPEKLLNLEKTTISFASKVIRGEIQSINKEDSILFNYLPTSDNRFNFNFLVNADFVSKTDREFIQVENKWNHYLFFKIGYKLIQWLNNLANEKNRKGYFTNLSSYLNLLPEKLLDENNDEQGTINNAFNSGLRKALNEIPFIVSYSKKMVKTDGIIVDRTGITKVLRNYGGKFFEEVVDSSKELPFFLVDDSKLIFSYLEIEQFEGSDLVTALHSERNRAILRDIIHSLNETDYLSFIKWFDDFIETNHVDNTLLRNLPIFKVDNEVLRFNDLKSEYNFILKTNSVNLHRRLFEKIGIRLTTINLEEYSNLWNNLEGFNLTGSEIYQRLSENELLHTLAPNEKAKLIAFIKNLEGVGKERYAESLRLFKDKSGNEQLKSLTSLVTNSETDLPPWLSHMIIDQDEEEALDDLFSTYLLKKEDLLHGLFCVPELYDQVIQNVDHGALNSFYQFLTELSENSEEPPTGRTEIPWVYIPSEKSFKKSDAVFLPESLRKLDEITYQSVSSVIESITDLMVPDYSSHGLIRELSLGTKSIDFTESINPGAAIGLKNIAPFLNWLSDNKEKSFFENFIVEDKDNSYLLSKTDRHKQYYTSSEKLVKYISKKDEESEYKLLPEGLFFTGLEKAGLLTSENLLNNIIDSNISDIDLVKFFEPQLSDSLFQKYLNSIERISIDTTLLYGADSSIAKIVELASKLVSKGEFDVDVIRSKIYVDGHQLSDTAISDDIYFKDYQYSPTLKLSEVLPDFQDKTYSYSRIRDIFPDTTNEILKLIFSPKQLTPRKIHKKLSEIDQEILSPEQTLFMVMYAHDQDISDPFKGKTSFTAYFDDNNLKYTESASAFFDLFVRESGFRQALNKLSFPDLVPELTVLNSEYAIDSEVPPAWFKEWVDKDESEQTVQFLKSIGFNHDDSAVVRLRKATLEKDSEVFDTARIELKNKQQILNTLLWLQKKQNSSDLEITDEFLQPLFKKAFDVHCAVTELPIPIFKMNGNSGLSLIEFNEGAQFYVKQNSWAEHADSIFSFLSTTNRYAVPGFLPEKYLKDLKVKEVEPTLELDKEKISKEAIEFEAPFYQDWDQKEELKILVHPEEMLPFNLIFDDQVLKEIDSHNFFFISNSELIISRSIRGSIPDILRSDLKEKGLDNLFNALKVQKDDWENQSEKKKEGINYSEDEIKALKRLFDENLPENYKKNYNLAALVSGLVELESLNYDVEEAYENLKNTHEYSQIEPVYKSEETITVMCRSARQGLLYLTAQAWNRLDDPEIKLYADLGNGKYQLYSDKQSVLNSIDSDVEFQILRIESESDLSNIEDILSGHFDAGKIWIIFKIKAKTNFDPIFYKSIQPDNTSTSPAPPKSESSDIHY